MAYFGASAGDNDFSQQIYNSIQQLWDCSDRRDEIFDVRNTDLKDVLCFMIAANNSIRRPDLWLSSLAFDKFDLDKQLEETRHIYNYMKRHLNIVVVDKPSKFPEEWLGNHEAIGIDLSTGYIWWM
jgi:hypothetical protein